MIQTIILREIIVMSWLILILAMILLFQDELEYLLWKTKLKIKTLIILNGKSNSKNGAKLMRN